MYCPNCGNKLDDNADVCLKCGRFIVKKKQRKTNNGVSKNQVMSIISMILAIISLFISLRMLFYNHTEFKTLDSLIAMFFYVFSCLFIELILGIVALSISLISRKEKSNFFNFTGLFVSMISFCVMAILVLLIISCG